MSANSFDARSTLRVGDESYEIFRLDKVEGSARLPYSLKVLLENLLRTEDGANITADHIRALGGWDSQAQPSQEIQFTCGPRDHAGLHRCSVCRGPRHHA